MTKNHLLGIYRTKLNLIQLSYASLIMWSYPDMREVFKKIYDAMDGIENTDICGVFPDVNHLLCDDASMRIASRELYSSAYGRPFLPMYIRKTFKHLCPFAIHNSSDMRMAIFPQPLHQRLGGMNKLFPLFFIDNHGNLFFNPPGLM